MIDTSIQRVEINQVIENQLPEFVQAESPLFVDFMKQYYLSQEYQGGSINIAENLDRYTKLQTYVGAALTEYTGLSTDTQSYSSTIFVDSTKGYPSKYGLLKIDDEIITYTGIGTTSFTGCVRGFSGISAIETEGNPEFLTFSDTNAALHTANSAVINLSFLFITEFYKKYRKHFLPGLEGRSFGYGLNVENILSRARDFYSSKGTDTSLQILFQVLYGEQVEIIKPFEQTLRKTLLLTVFCF